MNTIFLLTTVVAMFVVPPQEPDYKAVAKQVVESSKAQAEYLEKVLPSQNKRYHDLRKTRTNNYQAKQEKKKKMAELKDGLDGMKKRLRGLKSGKEFHYPKLATYDTVGLAYGLPWDGPKVPSKVGDFGTLARGATVFQVLNKDEALFTVHCHFRQTDRRKTVHVKAKIPTGGMVDGEWTEMPGVWIVTGTTTYGTRSGSNTVFVLENLDTEKIEAILKKKI